MVIFVLVLAAASFSQIPAIEPGVSHDLAKWRAARYSDVRYKLNLTLEKMSPVLRGTIEIRVRVSSPHVSKGNTPDAQPPAKTGATPPIILDWRKIKAHQSLSTISNVSINGTALISLTGESYQVEDTRPFFVEDREHLIFRDGVAPGENVIKLDFTSPILTSGSAITRYVDREDGAEYIYSLFVPSDASTAFPVFDQPDLKARFSLSVNSPNVWQVISNTDAETSISTERMPKELRKEHLFRETQPISTYVFAFTAGPWDTFEDVSQDAIASNRTGDAKLKDRVSFYNISVRKSQTAKFKPHAAEVFRLNREGIKFLESYFDYKFPFPKYDVVLIPEFPFGGMEHAGATFLREDRVIFPQEPTKNDYITRANVIFHEAAHQWFGDTVTMKWFDDLWLKEGFAEFMAYKTLEKVIPEYNAWKVFYERNKQAAYLTDSTKGTTPIYQEIANLNSAKSAYGNIVYRKAPSFLRQAEFYLGPDKFQTAVRAFLKKNEYANAGWEDLVKEFGTASGQDLKVWAQKWVTQRGVPQINGARHIITREGGNIMYVTQHDLVEDVLRPQTFQALVVTDDHRREVRVVNLKGVKNSSDGRNLELSPQIKDGSSRVFFENVSFLFPNYGDYGYGIFLLDDKSRDYVLKNIGGEKDDFLRSMMWGSLWDSVREGELDPKDYVELVVRNLKLETDESTILTLLGRVSTAMRYYLSEPPAVAGGLTRQAQTLGKNVPRKSARANRSLQPPATAGGSDLIARVENLLIDRMQNASTPGQRITYYRAFLNIASSENARRIMKLILKGSVPPAVAGGTNTMQKPAREQGRNIRRPGYALPNGQASAMSVTTKDRFDIVSRLIILGDPDAAKLLNDLEKIETSDEAKRYAYEAKAGTATADSKAKFWNDFINNKDISESWIEAAFGPFNSTRQSDLTLPYLEKALTELPSLKRSRKIFFVNGWLGAFIGGQKSEEALKIVNKFLADNPNLDNDLRLKILENVDLIERAVRIRKKFSHE